jgi:hypothetical protein
MMRSAAARVLLLGVVIFTLTACSRHVVVDPETVASRNDPDWNVHAAPVPTAVVSAPAQPTPPR